MHKLVNEREAFMERFEKSLELLKNESHLIGGWSGKFLGGGANLDAKMSRCEDAECGVVAEN